jgi:phenylalanine ammonia-lyase
MAAYMSELAYLANPVSTHVQSAEMHNQAINSLALVSARKTMEAVDIMSMMCASYLYVLCQALDLRMLTEKFIEAAKDRARDVTSRRFQGCCYNVQTAGKVEALADELWESIAHSWRLTGANDLHERCEKAVAATAPVFLQGLSSGHFNTEHHDHKQYLVILAWQEQMKEELESTYNIVRTSIFEHGTRLTASSVGQGSSKVYSFIRKELGVPMHRGLADAPIAGDTGDRKKLTVGSWVSIIYEALRDGRLYQPVMESVKNNELLQ